jgi:hypothetical protein
MQDMLHPAELSPASLRESLDRLLKRVAPEDLPPHYGGTERAVQILVDLAREATAEPRLGLRTVEAERS